MMHQKLEQQTQMIDYYEKERVDFWNRDTDHHKKSVMTREKIQQLENMLEGRIKSDQAQKIIAENE
jgi:hypothetical protein